MSSKYAFLSAMVIVIAGLTACKRHVIPATYYGKIIYTDACAGFTVQAIGSPLPPHVDSTWENPLNDSIYKNVFNAGISPSLRRAGLSVGDSIRYNIGITPPTALVYNTCAIHYKTPVAYNYPDSVEKIN